MRDEPTMRDETAGSPLAAPHVVALGEAMLRLTAPLGQRLERSPSLECHVAGSEANVAAGLARLGVPVGWVSALPANPLGDLVAAELRAAGVDLRFVQRPGAGRLGLFFAEQAPAPRATRVWYDRRGSSFTELDELPLGALDGARYAVVSGITPALGERSQRLAAAFLRSAESVGARICIDVNYRELLWQPDDARSVLAPMLARADVVVCSERDARTVFEIDTTGPEAALAFAEGWAAHAGVVILTRGVQGSVLVHGDSVTAHAAPPATVVDRFGAGDAFMAGLLWGLWNDRTPFEAVNAGAALAALKCTIAGDLARFGADELEAALSPVRHGAIQR